MESIDRAVLDRFDVKIEFGLPDRKQLQAALAYHARQLSPDDVAELVERHPLKEVLQDNVHGVDDLPGCRHAIQDRFV